ncbi:hypothetical protein [Arthrobacter sp. B3I4]|uniref:hypothetical protein n=1 Tax=Arthrobacter sp. B3I4 TaxID=3042267 RepID=UPI002785EBAA|nr:hypothetical protein [Arthrobacter sp. B3I4]MDQ0756186.1 hypothetical protein [Arthrobacter sp. B3I4]
MSQEQPPIRRRRELRQAWDERQEVNPDTGATGADAVRAAPGQDGVAGSGSSPSSERPAEPTEAETTGRRRIPGPVDSVRTTSAAQRSSQIRARDRAALRTIKELAEKEGQLSPGGPLTRRQLRLQQLAEETAPATSANPIVPMPSPRTRPQQSPASQGSAAAPAASDAAGGSSAAPGPNTVSAAPAGSAGTAGKRPEGMSVEQALAARELLAEQARNQLAKMDHIAATDPDAVNPEVLAEQIALAERAAVLNRRAAAKQKLAEQNNQPAEAGQKQPGQKPRTDQRPGGQPGGTKPATDNPAVENQDNGPSTASNLAMVTPLEFVEVPGVERPVMKRPATSYVPLVTNPSPKVQPPRTSRRPGSPRQRDAGPVSGRAGVLARAEEAAQAAARTRGTAASALAEPPAQMADAHSGILAEEDYAARPPVAANAAYGLDPLDAATAGLARARRLQALQLGILVLGVLALIAGIVLIITGMAR